MTKLNGNAVKTVTISVLVILLAAGIIGTAAMASQVQVNTQQIEQFSKGLERLAKIERDVAVNRSILERLEKAQDKDTRRP